MIIPSTIKDSNLRNLEASMLLIVIDCQKQLVCKMKVAEFILLVVSSLLGDYFGTLFWVSLFTVVTFLIQLKRKFRKVTLKLCFSLEGEGGCIGRRGGGGGSKLISARTSHLHSFCN